MSWVKIPVRSDIQAYSQRVELDSTIYILSFEYNLRMSKWIMGISDEQENPIYVGIVLFTGFPLTKDIIATGLPEKNFVCTHVSGEDIDPDDTNFGTDVVLLYGE